MFLTIAVALVALSASADTTPSVVQVGQVTVVAWPAQVQLAMELAELAEQPAAWPGLGHQVPGPLRLVVAPNAKTLADLSNNRAPAWGAAVAFPGSRTIILRGDLGNLRQTLRHELAHLALHAAVRRRLPLWFDEGYAAVAANEFDRMDALRLSWVVLRRAVPDFRQLDGALRGGPSAADQAYSLAMSAVLELGRFNPAGTIDSLLANLQRGVSFDSSVAVTTGRTVAQFEIEWVRALRHRYNLFVWMSAGGFWLVVLTLVGALLWARRRRDRTRRLALNVGWVVEEVEKEDLGPS